MDSSQLTFNDHTQQIPYGCQSIDNHDIAEVYSVLQSNWLTTGPKILEFENAIAEFVDTKYAIAVSSGTAALHCAIYAANIGFNDEVIIPSMTFAATANCVLFQGGKPVFVDVSPETLLINPQKLEENITDRTKAIIAVDYAGHPCDYDRLRKITDIYGLVLISDACHALGAKYKGENVGSIADMTVFSFHPVKHITTGEGGMITTTNIEYAERMRRFRNHGIDVSFRERSKNATWVYDITDLGYNYRITEIQCALGLSQLKKLPDFLNQRRKIAKMYDNAFLEFEHLEPLSVHDDIYHAYHLYVVKLDKKINRHSLFVKLNKRGIGVNVHYIPLHLHSYYKKKFKLHKGLCPIAEQSYEQILSLPIFPKMNEFHVQRIIDDVHDCLLDSNQD